MKRLHGFITKLNYCTAKYNNDHQLFSAVLVLPYSYVPRRHFADILQSDFANNCRLHVTFVRTFFHLKHIAEQK